MVRTGRALAATLLTLCCLAQSRTRADDSFLSIHADWEARAFAAASERPRCAARALHPAMTDGEIFWVFNTEHRETLPHGYLSIDRRLVEEADGAQAVIDGEARFSLRFAEDRVAYSRPADAARLFEAMRRGLDMEVVIDRRDGQSRALALSLRGFTRASDAARAACGFSAS